MTSGVPLSDTVLCKIATKDKDLPLKLEGTGIFQILIEGSKTCNDDKDIFCIKNFTKQYAHTATFVDDFQGGIT